MIVIAVLALILGTYTTANAYWPFPGKPPEQIEACQDVRGIDLSSFTSAQIQEFLDTLWFNQDTVWPEDILKLPLNPAMLMETAKNPGLGVRDLHREGITGEGVNAAIIDNPLFPDHPEFAGKIAVYKNFATDKSSDTIMHGLAVASLLVGTNTGTAPGARLYYAAVPSWLADSKYYADALNWIIEENRKLPLGKKIRVVSVSAAPSGFPFVKNNSLWDKACEAADREGILVVDCSMTKRRFIGACIYDLCDIENPAKCIAGYPGRPLDVAPDLEILVPTSPRTVAEEWREGEFSYLFTGWGGLSWGIPYAAGVLAMGWQVYPGMVKEQAVELLRRSAYMSMQNLSFGGRKLCRIINPKEFIRLVSEAKAQADDG